MNQLSYEPLDSFENLDSIFEIESDSKGLAENKTTEKSNSEYYSKDNLTIKIQQNKRIIEKVDFTPIYSFKLFIINLFI
jgi:hypothetical protein